MSTRSCKSNGTSNNILSKKVENSWLLLVREDLLKNNSFKIVSLSNPLTGKDSKYCLDDANKRIYEIVTFDEPYRSWFIGETVKSDPSVHLLTPINSLFLVLPKLKEQCINRAMQLEDILSEKGFDQITSFVTNLDQIADLKGGADVKAYKYNESKTLDWLEARVRRLANVLRDKNIHVTPGAASTTFVTSSVSNETVDDEFYLKYAHGLVSEYLPDDLIESLGKRFKFTPELIETLAKKRKSDVAGSQIYKKVKSEDMEQDHKENVSVNATSSGKEVKKPVVLTAKEKARQKAAGGMKTISSFFKKS